jgi:ribosomal-protein-alanine N-acetyltransferase
MSKAEPARESLKNILRVERMTEHDLLEVVEIEEMCGLSRWGWEAYHAELLSGHAGLMLVLRHQKPALANAPEKRLAGFVASRLMADELHINNIAVRPAFRRQGLAHVLLGRVLQEGARAGAREALLEVRASNKAAQALYERHDFRVAGRRKNYYAEPAEDALVMRAKL